MIVTWLFIWRDPNFVPWVRFYVDFSSRCSFSWIFCSAGKPQVNLDDSSFLQPPVLAIVNPLLTLALPWFWGPFLQAVASWPPLGPDTLWPYMISATSCGSCRQVPLLPICNPWLKGHSQLHRDCEVQGLWWHSNRCHANTFILLLYAF